MTDHFLRLEVARRPWPDEAELKRKFLELSSAAHPDRVNTGSATEREQANARFAEINSAYNCLRDPRERLAHLLQLESGDAPRQVRQIPADLADEIIPAEQLCREASGFLAEKARATSPMLKAQLFARALDWTDRIQARLQPLQQRRTAVEAEIAALNNAWAALDAVTDAQQRRERLPLTKLDELFRSWSYLSRFIGQLQERAVQMTM
jgi:DnaJ-domain-containing protein 1